MVQAVNNTLTLPVLLQITAETSLSAMLQSSLQESISIGLNWADGDTEGPVLLPSFQVAFLLLL